MSDFNCCQHFCFTSSKCFYLWHRFCHNWSVVPFRMGPVVECKPAECWSPVDGESLPGDLKPRHALVLPSSHCPELTGITAKSKLPKAGEDEDHCVAIILEPCWCPQGTWPGFQLYHRSSSRVVNKPEWSTTFWPFLTFNGHILLPF